MSAFLDRNGLARFLAKIKGLLSLKADRNLSNVTVSDFFSKLMETRVESIYTAESSDGIAYTVTVPGVTKLYAGLEITVIPSRISASTIPTINVNGLGAKEIRQPLSINSVATAPSLISTWLSPNCPIRLTYTGALWKTDFGRQAGSNIYGSVPITSGGTGSTTAEGALANLGAASVTYVNEQIASLVSRLEALEK